jgi:hypothetical protein
MEQRRDLRDKVTAPCPVKAPPCCLPKIGTTVWENEECERGSGTLGLTAILGQPHSYC